MNFHNFYSIYIFKDKKSAADIPTELPCLSDLENPSQLLMILSQKLLKFSDYSGQVFEVRESIADISTELPCLSYLENLG